MSVIEHIYKDTEAMAEAMTTRLHGVCSTALERRGHALLCLAGGRTPLPIYRALASSSELDWEGVAVLPSDDRCVAHDHPASNFSSLRAAFSEAAGVRIGALTSPDGNSTSSLAHARLCLSRHRGVIDAVVLGMGEDAHTASLFPGAETLDEAMAPASREDAFLIRPEPLPAEAPFPRITLGLARLLRAREHHLIITGARKHEVLRAAMAVYDPRHRPVSALLHAPQITMHVHWSP